MLWRKKSRLGVDLGSYSLKLCSLESNQQTCRVSCEELWPQRQGRENSKDPQAWETQVQKTFQEAEKRFKTGSKKLYLGISDPGMCTGYLELPNLKADQLAIAVPSAVAREIPQNLKDVQLFHLAVPPLQPQEKTGALFFVTLPKVVVENRKALLAQSGHDISSVEPGLLALVRGLNRNQAPSQTEPQLVVEVGFSSTTLLLMRQGYPYYSREFALGGGDFTYAIQMSEQVTWQEAENLKRSHDVLQGDFKQEPYLLRWETEMKRSLDFLRSRWPNLFPKSVLMTGGGSLWKGLPQRLQQLLELPVELQNWSKVQPSSGVHEEASPTLFARALGLVTRP